MNNLTTEKLSETIAKRHACLQQLHKLGTKQTKHIQTGEMGSLLRLLSVKNQLIVALQAIEQQLAPFHSQDPEQRVWSSLQVRERCARQAAECQTLLAEIMQMERDNEQRMLERRDQVASQLQTVQSATVARRAYQAQQTASHRSPAPDSYEAAVPVPNLHTEA